jgi:hypothetical protein
MGADTHPTPTQAAATRLLRRSCAPIPVPAGKKAPSLPEWQNLRVTEADVPAYFNGSPQNIGVLLGEPSNGLADVDLDAAEAVQVAPAFLPPTGSRFGRPSKRGSHWEYRAHPIPQTIRYRAQDGTTLVELRSTGAQTIFPPSIHPSGEPVEWEQDEDPAPVDSTILVAAVARVASAALLARQWPEKGSRHDAALALVGGLLRGGWSPDDARHFVLQVARASGDDEADERTAGVRTTAVRLDSDQSATGWTHLGELVGTQVVQLVRRWLGLDRDARATVRDAVPATDSLPVPPFPLETLPAVFRTLVEDAATNMVMPADYLAVPLLVTAGATIGNALELELKSGWAEGPNLYAASVGTPGSKKSPAHRLANRAIRRVQLRLKRQFDEERRQYLSDLAAWEGAKKSERGLKPDEPVFPHLLTTDSTTEALAPMLLAAKGIALCKDELVSWVTSMNQYRGGKGADRQLFLSMWSRELIKVDRKGGPPIVVARPCLAVIGGIQPEMLPELADASRRDDGFLDRLLWSYPPPVPDHWTDNGISEANLTTVEHVFELLYRLPRHVDEDGDSAPYLVRFSDTAKELWRDWFNEFAVERDSGAIPSRLQGPWAKLPSQLARLALILHVVTKVASCPADASSEALKQAVLVPLSQTTLGAAMDVLEYFKAHARRVYAELGQQQHGMAVRILQALQERGPCKQSVLLHEVFHGHGSTQLRRTLEELEEAGLVRRYLEEHTGGRPATIWARQ